MNRKPASPAWLKQILRWLEESEDELPEPAFLNGDFPEWVQKLSRDLISTLCPVAKLKVGKAWTAAEVGALMGHKLAYLHAVDEGPPPPIAARLFKTLDRKTVALVKKQAGRFAKKTNAAIKRSLALASEQTYTEAANFFTAFGKALNLKPVGWDASNLHRSNTRVYWLLLLGWPSVNRLRSVRELQQALCRYLDPYVVGDVKRIEKMCQRLGLHFGARGRPRKSE
jgi:hypothetical protein